VPGRFAAMIPGVRTRRNEGDVLRGGVVASDSLTTGYAPVNGVEMYWESRGSGGTPLVVVYGGYGLTSMFSDLLDDLADRRRVVAIELQGHGHTRDIDRPFSFEAFGDDIAGLIDSIGADRADLLGYSLGGQACLRCTIQHPVAEADGSPRC
jgi:pimeloyl-ACP methyl ester carboxylesterase